MFKWLFLWFQMTNVVNTKALIWMRFGTGMQGHNSTSKFIRIDIAPD